MLELESEIQEFRKRHRLPAAFTQVAESYFLPLAHHLATLRTTNKPLLVGINGAQGTGKTTLADFLCLAGRTLFNWNVANLSIDDFYLTRAERTRLATDVHPLLRTRGVPGTHDTKLLAKTLDALARNSGDSVVQIPRFDKATDDRAAPSQWTQVSGSVDLILLEGWCVASQAQEDDELATNINSLELEQDEDGRWRHFVNEQLRVQYSAIFEQLNLLILVRAPNVESSYRWRLEQERKLGVRDPNEESGVMSGPEIKQFMLHFERLTLANLENLPARADIVLDLDESHAVVACSQRSKPRLDK